MTARTILAATAAAVSLFLAWAAYAADVAALKNWSANEQRLQQKCDAINQAHATQIKCSMDRASWTKVLTPEWFEKTGESMSYAGVAADRCDLAMTDLAGGGSYTCFASKQPSKVSCRSQIEHAVKSIVCKGTRGASSLTLTNGTLTINAGDDAGQDVWDLDAVKRLFSECQKHCD